MRGRFQPIKTLSSRLFRKNRGRNVVAVLAILMTTLMFTTLFTLAQSMSKNMVEMTFRQTGYDAQASFKSITGEEAALIGAHPDVREVGESIVLGVAENRELKGHQTEIRWGDDSYAAHSFAWPTAGRMPEAADELAAKGVKARVISMPCWEVFEAQDAAYKESVLPKNVRARLAVEAAADFGWQRYTGLDGDMICMNGFGASAPAGLLFKDFGFTVENVVEKALALVK